LTEPSAADILRAMKTPHYVPQTLRSGALDPVSVLVERFPAQCPNPAAVDAQFLDAASRRLFGCAGLAPRRPIVRALLNDAVVLAFVRQTLAAAADGLLVKGRTDVQFFRRLEGRVEPVAIPAKALSRINRILRASGKWVGEMNDAGDYICDPRTPAPGTHFRANLLIGDRGGFANPLLTTPKALVDEWGRGSSRSHADKQILATRWDVVPEENGFPANRQFYIVENERQIFYSAAPAANVKMATRHAANHTVITYELPDGLKIERTIFIVPAEPGLPLGVEAQLIRLENSGGAKRDLKVVVTGMFGCLFSDALVVDVIYTCVTLEPRILHDAENGGPLVVAPRYNQTWCQEDHLFNLSLVHYPDGTVRGAESFCLDYRRFVGNGTLEQPQHVLCLDNVYAKKGPGFYALALPCVLEPGASVECQTFNGSVSRHEGEEVTPPVFIRKVSGFAEKAMRSDWARAALQRVKDFQDSYRGAVQVTTPNKAVNRLVNVHLPFQIRYQTYVSRSFALTQKGFRKIGFREIQDLFAALPFEVAAGRREHIRDLIGLWAGHVHRFGYADHQFYWTGFEPGRYSDDALWLFQAVGRYIDLTGDQTILDTEWPVAGENGKRRLFDTLQACLIYSGKISIGKNGLPLIDHADWNDTLNLDDEGIHGPEKEKLYRQQIADGLIKEGEAFQSDLSESVMNGFLLEIARAYMVRFARMAGAAAVEREWSEFAPVLAARLQNAWKGDFFCRAFLNRPNAANTSYLGGRGDNLSDDPRLPGAYFLNSFTWPILSGIATEEQIGIMLERIEDALLTPVGLRLSSPTKYHAIMPRFGSGDYLYGDRENGAVFKHANMMAANAMVQAARTVQNKALAGRLLDLAWKVLQMTAPFVTFEDPYKLAGNPRFCTQYTNPATGEHIGPLLSGTAPWMWLTYLGMIGVNFHEGRVTLDPVLPPEWKGAAIELHVPAGRYHIEIAKPRRFVRKLDQAPTVTINGAPGTVELPRAESDAPVKVDVRF